MSQVLDTLLQNGLIQPSEVQQAAKAIAEGQKSIMNSLLAYGIAEDRLQTALAKEFECPYYASLETFQVSGDFLSRFPARVLLEKTIAPLKEENGVVHAAIADPFDLEGVDQLRMLTGAEFEIALAGHAEISGFVKKHLGLGADTIQTMVDEARQQGLEYRVDADAEDVDLMEAAEGASIIRFVNQILTEAIEMRATDVHIEPFEDELRVRYRIDGVLKPAAIPSNVKPFQLAIVSRIKILSHLDIAEKRVPQDGRIKVVVGGKEVDIRVSIIPMLYGEAVVLRLLDCSSVLLGLDSIGMGKEHLDIFEDIINRPHGIILVTGPTGSGKTTTLYAALSRINDLERKIVTIEDPVEYHLHGVNQIQVSSKTGLTFSRGLRSILRHDPDVILVGEVRDLETAEIAVQASLTGHLVFSTLHTNDAPGALTRLVDMGIEPYLVASSLEAVLAQRLIRIICPECKDRRPDSQTDMLRKRYGSLIPDTLHYGKGCKYCRATGYVGRKGIFELMVISETVRALLLQNADSRRIRMQAAKEGMKSLRQDVRRYLVEGLTTIEEVLRVTKDEPIAEKTE
ncbi:MAG: Flp pilus assembly complex ATPase component TadA [Planctomycetaceae bacterium]|nr:Flp pilus assembly complex ATPase component TadA [Planctomycetaceae bacterium]